MAVQQPVPASSASPSQSFQSIALLLQGGGALGAYQGGVYEALSGAGIEPTWVAGISIGAANAALIAGNPPGVRLQRLRDFWEGITTSPVSNFLGSFHELLLRGDVARTGFNLLSAGESVMAGAPGFFRPRIPGPWFEPPGSLEATSYYDTSALKGTLERLVDFDRVNRGEIRFSVGAVNVRTGNFAYFDTTTDTIRAEHVMASGAIPPGFPAVEIDGDYYWDGGLVSNTPLQWVLENGPCVDTLAFQVDLWSARGEFPRTLLDVPVRQKDIQFSSRTRDNTDHFRRIQKLRHALATLLPEIPEHLRSTDEYKLLAQEVDQSVYNLVHLIYRSKRYEGDSKDYEFSRLTMEEHWEAGFNDAKRALKHKEIFERPQSVEGIVTFDFDQ